MTSFLIFVIFVWLIILSAQQCETSGRFQYIIKKLNAFDNEMPRQAKELKAEVVEQQQNIQQVEPIVNESSDNCVDIKDEETTPIDDKAKIINEPEPQLLKEKNNFEKIFLGNIFNKIGAIALIVGFIIFIKLISPYIFTPIVKLLLGYFAGFGMMFGAFKINFKENLKDFSEVLMGTSLGTLFITTYCGCTILNIFNTTVAIIIATLFLVFSFYLAQKFKKISTISITLLAGYLNPFIITTNADFSSTFTFGYLLFVNLLSLICVWENPKISCINYINLILTFLCALTIEYNSIVMPAILWVIYTIYDLISEEDNTVLNYINYSIFILFAVFAFNEKIICLAILLLILAIVFAIITFVKSKKGKNIDAYYRLILISSNFAIYLLTREYEYIRSLIWSSEAILLAYLSTKFNFKPITNWTLGAILMAFVSIIHLENVFYIKNIEDYIPIFNTRLLVMLPIIMSSVFCYKLLKNNSDNVNIFRFQYLTLSYLFFVLEINACISKYFTNEAISISYIQSMINIIIGFIYTIQLKRLHGSTNNILFALSYSFVGICSLIALLIMGVQYEPLTSFIPFINIRVIAFLFAIGTSILFSRWTNNNFYKYFAILLGFYLVHFEIANTIEAFQLKSFEYLLSVGWILYAGIITLVGIYKNKKILKYSGIAFCILSIVRIFIFDLASLDVLYKFVAFLVLGTILMFISYIYNKKQA